MLPYLTILLFSVATVFAYQEPKVHNGYTNRVQTRVWSGNSGVAGSAVVDSNSCFFQSKESPSEYGTAEYFKQHGRFYGELTGPAQLLQACRTFQQRRAANPAMALCSRIFV